MAGCEAKSYFHHGDHSLNWILIHFSFVSVEFVTKWSDGQPNNIFLFSPEQHSINQALLLLFGRRLKQEVEPQHCYDYTRDLTVKKTIDKTRLCVIKLQSRHWKTSIFLMSMTLYYLSNWIKIFLLLMMSHKFLLKKEGSRDCKSIYLDDWVVSNNRYKFYVHSTKQLQLFIQRQTSQNKSNWSLLQSCYNLKLIAIFIQLLQLS